MKLKIFLSAMLVLVIGLLVAQAQTRIPHSVRSSASSTVGRYQISGDQFDLYLLDTSNGHIWKRAKPTTINGDYKWYTISTPSEIK